MGCAVAVFAAGLLIVALAGAALGVTTAEDCTVVGLTLGDAVEEGEAAGLTPGWPAVGLDDIS
jgi:hypothetical protein